MVLFCNDSGLVRAIPQNCIQQIICSDVKIQINYFDGEYNYFTLEGRESVSAFPLIKVVKIIYGSEEIALEKMREFYKSCENNKGAFFF